MLGIITGSGFYQLDSLKDAESRVVETEFGSAALTHGSWNGNQPVVFLARHGTDHSVPPHAINYRANISALKNSGVDAIVATAVTGGMRAGFDPGSFVVIDDFIDFTHGRASTFFDAPGNLTHVDMTDPYDATLRARLIAAAGTAGVAIAADGTYCATNGPRFETKAEIEMMHRMGGDLVGMTGCPEVVLANEIGIPYAALGVISNRAAGMGGGDFTLDEIMAVLDDAKAPLERVLTALIEDGS